MRVSCKPIVASARIEKFDYYAGETFHSRLFLLNDGRIDSESGIIRVKLYLGESCYELLEWQHGIASANENKEGPEISFNLPVSGAEWMRLVLESELYGNEYLLKYNSNKKSINA